MTEYITIRDPNDIIHLVPLHFIMSIDVKTDIKNVVVFNMHAVYHEKYVEARSVLLDMSVTGEARIARYYNPDGMTYHNKYDGTEHILEFQNAVGNAHLIARRVFSR